MKKGMIVYLVLVFLTTCGWASASPSGQSCPEGMVSYWEFDDGSGTTAYDSVGDNNGELIGSYPTWATGIVGGSLDFSDIRGYVKVPKSSDFVLTGDMSMEIWIYPTKMPSEGSSEWILDFGVSGRCHQQALYLTTNDILAWQTYNSCTGDFLYTDPLLSSNTWYHIVTVRKDSKKYVYINGVQDPTVTSFDGTIGNPKDLWIGKRDWGNGNSFDGKIDEFAIYDRALNPEEIQQHYLNGLNGQGYCVQDQDNDGILDDEDNCPLVANTEQSNFDGDAHGDACDADDDNDGVTDIGDTCLWTPLEDIINADGCSIAQLCPADTGYKNHGNYVSYVSKTAETFLNEGLITEAQKDATVSEAAKSGVGKKAKK